MGYVYVMSKCICTNQPQFSYLLVYDTCNSDTFDKLEEWLNEVEMYSTKKDIVKMLVGNKIDKVQCIK